MAKGSKKGACSSNTQAAKANCLAHDRREGKVPSYVNPHLTNTNRVVFEDELVSGRKSIVPLVKKAEKEYTEKTGQKVQASFAAFRESVLHLRSGISDEQLLQFKTQAESLTGWKCVGIYLHQDEGHVHSKYIEGDEDFDINYHAHVLWDCQDHQTGKSIKCTRSHLSKMQDLLAEATGMERGNKASETGRTHRSAQEQRIIAQQERIEQLELECEKAKEREKKAKEAERKAREKEIWANGRTREAERKAREAVLSSETKRGVLMMRDGGRFLAGGLSYLGGSMAYLGGKLTGSNARQMSELINAKGILERENERLKDALQEAQKEVEETKEDRGWVIKTLSLVPGAAALEALWYRIKHEYVLMVNREWFHNLVKTGWAHYKGQVFWDNVYHKIDTWRNNMPLRISHDGKDLQWGDRTFSEYGDRIRERQWEQHVRVHAAKEGEKEEEQKTEERQETRSIGRGFRR